MVGCPGNGASHRCRQDIPFRHRITDLAVEHYLARLKLDQAIGEAVILVIVRDDYHRLAAFLQLRQDARCRKSP